MKYVPPLNGDLENPNRPYIDGNPTHGVEGSIPPANVFEHPMREILAVIEAAGLEPDGEDLTQLKQVIDTLAPVQQVEALEENKADKSSFNNLLSKNGRQYVAGTLFQWGEVTRTANLTPVLFPTTYPNEVFQVFVSNLDSVSGFADISSRDVIENGFNVLFDDGSDVTRARWFAIGY